MTFPCPAEALPRIAETLAAFGCTVVFERDGAGFVTSIAGELRFSHDSGTLTVEITDDRQHFPPAMLIGGIRQVVEEAVEGLR